jgi:hypothetical protein
MAPVARSDKRTSAVGESARPRTGPFEQPTSGCGIRTRALPYERQSNIVVSIIHTVFVRVNGEDLTVDRSKRSAKNGRGVSNACAEDLEVQGETGDRPRLHGTFAQRAGHPAFNRRDEGALRFAPWPSLDSVHFVDSVQFRSNPSRPTVRQQTRGVAAAHPALTR